MRGNSPAGPGRDRMRDRQPLPRTNGLPAGSAMLSDRAWAVIADSLGLTRRQIQIVRLVLDDATELAMAGTLGVSMHTVHTHLDRIHKKLGVHSRVELVVLLLDEFLRLTVAGTSGLPPLCARHAQGKCPMEWGARVPVEVVP